MRVQAGRSPGLILRDQLLYAASADIRKVADKEVVQALAASSSVAWNSCGVSTEVMSFDSDRK